MKVDLKPFLPNDKNMIVNSSAFIGTTIQSYGDLKGYSVQIVLFGLAIPSRRVQTNEAAKTIENDIWTAMTDREVL